MQDFQFFNPTKLVFGRNSMGLLADNVRNLGATRVLVTYGGGSIKENGIYEKVMEQLQDAGVDIEEFGGIEPNPRVETVRKGIEVALKFNPDLILAVGGGSVIDGSKLLAAATHYDGDAWDFLVKPGVAPSKYIPLATVLTLTATCSEMNSGAVITNWTNHEKLFFLRNELYPVFSILDPVNTFTVPRDQTVYGLIDIFTHVIEQYINTTADAPLQDRFAEGIMKTVLENAQAVLDNPEDYDARANIMLSGSMALNGLIMMGEGQDWATHDIEHELSAFYDITHAAGLAVILPKWMDIVAKEQKLPKLAQYGRRVWSLVGDDEEVADQAITKTYEFFEGLGAVMNFSGFEGVDINDEHFETMVSRLVSRGIGEIALDAGQINAILQSTI